MKRQRSSKIIWLIQLFGGKANIWTRTLDHLTKQPSSRHWLACHAHVAFLYTCFNTWKRRRKNLVFSKSLVVPGQGGNFSYPRLPLEKETSWFLSGKLTTAYPLTASYFHENNAELLPPLLVHPCGRVSSMATNTFSHLCTCILLLTARGEVCFPSPQIWFGPVTCLAQQNAIEMMSWDPWAWP